jgi:hypothetical protein
MWVMWVVWVVWRKCWQSEAAVEAGAPHDRLRRGTIRLC